MNPPLKVTADSALDAGVDVFTGRVTSQLAKVYVRCPNDSIDEWKGYIEGPFCEFAETLTSRARLSDLGLGESRLAMAGVVDPCVWSPLHPSYYRLHLQVTKGRHTETLQRDIGICGFSIRDTDFRMDSKRWVLRAVGETEVGQDELLQARESLSGIILDVSGSQISTDTSGSMLENVLSETSRLGVPVAANVTQTAKLESLLRRLSRYPSVLCAVLPSADDIPERAAQIAPNICLAQAVDDWSTVRPSPWSSAYCWNVPPTPETLDFKHLDRPLLALRRATPSSSMAEKRAACDALQRDLASIVECAGFLV